MVAEGLLTDVEVSLPAIRRIYAEQPARVDELMRRNESYVFFREADANEWPAGSLGFPVGAERSLATDKKIFPRGGLVMVDTRSIRRGQALRTYQRFMLDQDTGGAIRAPGRADLFMGTGVDAEALAGSQKAEGRLYYFFLKPERVAEWLPSRTTGAGASR
jgi:membrane-bound lytic murein transglycosylase A